MGGGYNIMPIWGGKVAFYLLEVKSIKETFFLIVLETREQKKFWLNNFLQYLQFTKILKMNPNLMHSSSKRSADDNTKNRKSKATHFIDFKHIYPNLPSPIWMVESFKLCSALFSMGRNFADTNFIADNFNGLSAFCYTPERNFETF